MTIVLEDGREIPISHPGGGFRPFKGDRPVKVRLFGELATAAGNDLWELAVSSVREAVRALHYLTNGATTRYIDQHSKVRWRVMVNEHVIDGSQPSVADELMIERDIESIDIYPVMEGAASGGILEAILGAILIVVSVVLFFVNPTLTFLGVNVAGALFLGGASILLGGLVSLFSTPAKTTTPKSSTGNPSYLFSGPVNTQQQGGCVPVAYGNVIIGSQTISAFVVNSDLLQVNGPQAYQKLPQPFSAAAVTQARVEGRANAMVTEPWSELGPDGFWGYCNGVTIVPYDDDVPMLQEPVGQYPSGPSWLVRLENGAIGASYDPGGNYGPWETLINAPMQLDSIILTLASDQFETWEPTPNES